MKKLLFSIIILTFNGGKTIGKLLKKITVLKNNYSTEFFQPYFKKVIYEKQIQLFKEKLHKATTEYDETYFGDTKNQNNK